MKTLPLSKDALISVFLLSIVALVGLVYLWRVFRKGRVHFDRVDKQGSSLILSKSSMEMAHWGMEPLARFFISLKITANQISWASLAFGILAAVFLVNGLFGAASLATLFAIALDLLDGMVARLTGTSSNAGEVLDASLDRYVEFLFFGALVIYYRNHPILMFVTLAALMGSFMVSYSTAKAESFQIKPPSGNMRRPERVVFLTLGATFSALTIPYERGPNLGFPMIFSLVCIAFGANVSAALRLYAIARQLRILDEKAS